MKCALLIETQALEIESKLAVNIDKIKIKARPILWVSLNFSILCQYNLCLCCMVGNFGLVL